VYDPATPLVNRGSGGTCENGGDYGLGIGVNSGLANGTWNLRAWYDEDGDNQLDNGERYDELGSYASNFGSPRYDFVFAGTNCWQAACPPRRRPPCRRPPPPSPRPRPPIRTCSPGTSTIRVPVR